MILHRLLVAMQANNIGFVTTSNFRPDELYPDGLHRDRLPTRAVDPAHQRLGLDSRLPVVDHHSGTGIRQGHRHALPNALIPLVTVVIHPFGAMFSTAILMKPSAISSGVPWRRITAFSPSRSSSACEKTGMISST